MERQYMVGAKELLRNVRLYPHGFSIERCRKGQVGDLVSGGQIRNRAEVAQQKTGWTVLPS
jgi:hypothetical protein